MSGMLTNRLRASTETRFKEDWARQRRTAADILQRLSSQEGVVLADQVGMGKTYVALAVAVSQILAAPERAQVVVFVPAAVADKWVREWSKFSASLLEPETGIRCVDHAVRSGEEFLKRLDDSPETRKHIIIVTHTALTATLKDTFIQLALLHHATRFVKEGAQLRQRIAKWSTGQTGLIRSVHFTPERVDTLLKLRPSKWHESWKKMTGENLPDDPVPTALANAIRSIELKDLRAAIERLPKNRSGDIEARLQKSREKLAEVTQATWKNMLSAVDLDLPLLIVDEAHRLKNPSTNISRLFGERSDNTDDGAFKGIFRRMLFMTATPFELGHSELIEVLSRMDAVRPLEPPPALALKTRLGSLKTVLTAAQASALALDGAWARLKPNELGGFGTWGPAVPPPVGFSTAAREAWEYAKLAVQARRKMHMALRPWVIRHERARRRSYHAGAAIIADKGCVPGGLQIPDSAALPFLLAARAQSVALDTNSVRPLFAYGIASSYEAFLRLGSEHKDGGRDTDFADEDRTNDVAPDSAHGAAPDAIGWYRREIDQALADPNIRGAHPKVQATVEKAAQLWLEGEKCLIFCWFIRTGEAVEQALTRRVDGLILAHASAALKTRSAEQTRTELDSLSDRLLRRGTSSYLRMRRFLEKALAKAAGLHPDVLELVVDAAIRHLRTHSYLVRYTTLTLQMTVEDIWEGVNGKNPRGIVLLDRWRLFAERLASARPQADFVNSRQEHDSEFARTRAALLGTDADDDHGARRGASLHPVRRAHGGTERSVRERLIALFNTPLSPDLLVASSVMGEGIDLHQECRFVIHHDLDWNPGVLEQRTGRLDRIGALAEREGKNIEVYEPYLAGTHDEKMFRVVKDRSQWFDIVMGRAASAAEQATDAEETRVPLHHKICEALTMDLRSPTLK